VNGDSSIGPHTISIITGRQLSTLKCVLMPFTGEKRR
jgi:hypothetical protein